MDAEAVIGSGHLRMEGVVDYRGRPITSRSTSGGWTSSVFIIGVEMAERFAYYGVSSNLITYLTEFLGESTASAAANVNAWSGASMILPLLGGFLADAFVGRYRSIVFASGLYVLGLGMLTLSATVPFLRPATCIAGGGGGASNSQACHPTQLQVAFFYFSLYTVAAAQGGHKPCVQAFGADQFDENDPKEGKSKSSFFNWWYFGMCSSTTLAIMVLSYVQDRVSWGLGFGVPCVSMVVALVVFLMGTRTYRFYALSSEISSLAELIGKSCAKMWKSTTLCGWCCSSKVLLDDHEAEEALLHQLARPSRTSEQDDNYGEGKAAELTQQQLLIRLFPIWASCLLYAVAVLQPGTFFTKQGSTVDRRIAIGPTTFLLTPAALQGFITLSIVVVMPIYDRVFVPIAGTLIGTPSGVTMLQRIGIGMLLSVASMAVAALVETRRLRIAMDSGLIDLPNQTVPMSLWWLLPQYILCGISEAFAMVGLQELFYDQVPDGLRSLGLGLYLGIFGVGGFLSSLLVLTVDKVSSRSGGSSWFCDNLNRAHIDYFYWLLAVLGAVEMVFYVYFARSFNYKRRKGNGTVY